MDTTSGPAAPSARRPAQLQGCVARRHHQGAPRATPRHAVRCWCGAVPSRINCSSARPCPALPGALCLMPRALPRPAPSSRIHAPHPLMCAARHAACPGRQAQAVRSKIDKHLLNNFASRAARPHAVGVGTGGPPLPYALLCRRRARIRISDKPDDAAVKTGMFSWRLFFGVFHVQTTSGFLSHLCEFSKDAHRKNQQRESAVTHTAAEGDPHQRNKPFVFLVTQQQKPNRYYSF